MKFPLHIVIYFLLFVCLIGLSVGKTSLSKEQLLKKANKEPSAFIQQQPVDQSAPRKNSDFLHSGDAQVPPGLLIPNRGGDMQHGLPPEFDGVPPGFEKVLPKETITQLRALHKNHQLSLPQKQAEFDRIMSAVPGETLAKLPLPPGFEELPDQVQQQIRAIHGDLNMNWSQKHGKVAELIESLPPEQRPRPPPGFPVPPQQPDQDGQFFPPNPPPGFERVLPPDVYAQLVQIHRNPQLGVQQKSHQIDLIMRSLPQAIIDQLPLPPGFDQLPEKYIKEARAIFGDKTLSFQEKDRKVFEFVRSLPAGLRRLVRPPLPPAFERLNSDTKEQIVNLFEDDSLDDGQRQKRFWQLVNGLPEQERAQVQAALKFPA